MRLSNLAKTMIQTILIIALICIVGSVIYYRSLDCVPYVLGVLIGAAVSIVKVFLLERAVGKVLTMKQKNAGNYVAIQHMFRLFISGAALVLGAVVPQISLWGVASGILAFQFATYSLKFMSKELKSS